MVSHRRLLQSLEAALVAGPKLPAQQRTEIAHLLHVSRPDFESFLEHRPPSSSDRAQVLAKEVRLPNGPVTPLDDQDVQIVLKLSDDLNLNEIECVSLLIAAHQEWSLLGREPLEILRLSLGLWFTERRALITSLQLLLRAVVLDEELDPDLVADIQQYVEGLLRSGMRQKLMTLIKSLSREEPAGCGGPGVEQCVVDSRGALVRRSSVASRERLSLSQCLVFSCLIVRMRPQEMKEIYSLLKDCSQALTASNENVKLQISYTLMFVIFISLISDALSGTAEMPSVLSVDAGFRKEFQDQVMESGGNECVEGFCSTVRLVWAVFLMLSSNAGSPLLSSSASESNMISSILDQACDSNPFKFLVTKVLRTPAFQNDDEDMIFMYRAYIHKLITSVLSQPLAREKVKRMRDAAMVSLESNYYETSFSSGTDDQRTRHQQAQMQAQPFLSMLDLITEIYEKEPDLTIENEALWNFARFAGESHTSHLTLVSFLRMLTALASSEDGARKVYLLLQNKASWSVGWHTLFNSLNIYEQHFKQTLQSTGALLPPFQEGDAKALEAYLQVLKKVMENGNKLERSEWFPDIEPLFKLLSYENVPPYLKGALRNSIATFVTVTPHVKDKVWALLEQYDLPMVVGPAAAGINSQQHSAQVYDMSFELNEVEARREEYPSTLSYIRLLNALISTETETSDKGARFLGIFKFVRDQIFATHSQRAFSDMKEKWQMVVACLKHFQMMLSLFSPTEEDIRCQVDYLPDIHSAKTSISKPNGAELPTIEVMKDFMSGKTIFRNVMSILMLGVNTVVEDRLNESHGPYLEEAVLLSLELLLLSLNKDSVYADAWRPVYQPVDAVLAHDNRQIIVLLEYIRYDASQVIQQFSVKIMDILSARLPQLVSVILEGAIADNLIEDYAACLESRSQEIEAPENTKEDIGFLILQLLLSNLSRPSPNVTHLLLKFNVDLPVERTVLQPKRHYSCLRVLLNVLETLSKPDVNATIHELGLQLLYELSVDYITSAATIELLQSEKYNFFSKHLEGFICEPLPKRKTNQVLRTSSLHQRAWLLKLLAVQLHVSDMDIITQRENCHMLLSRLFTEEAAVGWNESSNALVLFNATQLQSTQSSGSHRTKALELLDVIQFQPPEIESELPWELQTVKDDLMVNDILGSPTTVDEGGVYYISERGDRLIELTAFRDRLWQEYKRLEIQQGASFGEQRQAILRDAVQHLLRWGWKFNKNVEEQAAQLHMLMGWSQLIEVGISRRFELVDFQLHILLEIIDASLTATISQDCSLKMAISLSQVVMTCMAKLQELSFTCPGGEETDDVTYMDMLFSVRLSNSACQTIFSKLVASILRADTSETLRRRQYTILICYLHYCQGTVDPDISLPVMRSLLLEGHDGEDADLEKLDKEQEDLLQMNLSIIKGDAVGLVNLLAKDITQGSEMGKAMAFYTLDALLAMDSEQVIINQLQSRGLLQGCLQDISTNSYQAVLLPSPASVRRLYTLESELALLLRVGLHNKKRGAQTLFAMGVMQHLTACKAIDVQLTNDVRWEQVLKMGSGLPSQHDKQHQIVLPVLRIVSCLAILVESDKGLEQDGSEVPSEILEFIKAHHPLCARILRDEKTGVQMENLKELDLVTGILSKVWHLVSTDDLGFNQALFNLASAYFIQDADTKNRYVLCVLDTKRLPGAAAGAQEVARRLELLLARVRCNLISFLFSMVSRRGLRFHYSNSNVMSDVNNTGGQFALGRQKQPTLSLIASLLEQTVRDLESAIEERSLLLAKVQDVNELSRHEVDDIIKAYSRVERALETDGIRKRRYIAMIEMSSAAGNRESLITLLYYIIEHALNILFIHYEKELQLPEEFHGVAQNGNQTQSYFGTADELRALNEKILPSLQHLERINEERISRSDKQIRRLVRSLKSRIITSLQ